jgi:hypothetical protein
MPRIEVWRKKMNSLSWMIYAAELTGSASAFSTFLSCASGVAAGAATFAYVITDSKPIVWSWEDAGQKHQRATTVNAQAKGLIRPALISMLAFGVAATLLPSKSTVYAIAASEMGEKALSTPTASKAIKALDAWLDRQIAGDTGTEDKPQS